MFDEFVNKKQIIALSFLYLQQVKLNYNSMTTGEIAAAF